MNTIQNIKNAILSIQGVDFCHIKVNNEFYPDCEDDCEDLPLGMSISIFTSGGDDLQIAKTIYNNKPVGIALNGDFCLNVDGVNIHWYNLNFEDYTLQKSTQNRLGRKLEREYLLKRLEELGDD